MGGLPRAISSTITKPWRPLLGLNRSGPYFTSRPYLTGTYNMSTSQTAFLHSVLPKSGTVYMEQPPGFKVRGKEDWVMRLIKSLYSMKQASRIWNQTFHKTFSQLGFKCLVCEWCVYQHPTATGVTIFAIHVGDITVFPFFPLLTRTLALRLSFISIGRSQTSDR